MEDWEIIPHEDGTCPGHPAGANGQKTSYCDGSCQDDPQGASPAEEAAPAATRAA